MKTIYKTIILLITISTLSGFSFDNDAKNTCQTEPRCFTDEIVDDAKSHAILPCFERYMKRYMLTMVARFEKRLESETKNSANLESTLRINELSPRHSVCGVYLDEQLDSYYWDLLLENEITYWYDIGLCQMFQESGFNIYAENKNGLDKGLLQYRIIYWNEACSSADICGREVFDPYSQIYVYVFNVSKMVNTGMVTKEVISNHKTGGGWYDDTYVNDVLRWLSEVR